MEDTDKELEQNVDFDWYLMLLAVAPKHQRQGYGSRFMTEGIEPFLEEIQGKKTSLLYQYQRKCLFFTPKMATRKSIQVRLALTEVEMGSWYFLKGTKKH